MARLASRVEIVFSDSLSEIVPETNWLRFDNLRKSHYRGEEVLKECKTLTPISDQEIISPYNIHTLSSRRVLRIKKNINLEIINWFNTKFSKLTS